MTRNMKSIPHQASVSEVLPEEATILVNGGGPKETPTVKVEEEQEQPSESEEEFPHDLPSVEQQILEAIARLTITHEDVVITVMGITGVGKSRFISYLTEKDIQVGHSLRPCTSVVDVFPYTREDGRTVYLVDTPGFNDMNKTDAEILELVSVFLSALYKKNIKLAGMVYLHDITATRMLGEMVLNLELFEKLCGEDALKKCVAATTKWDKLPLLKDGEDREQQLKDEFWTKMIEGGSKVFRQDDGARSAKQIIDYLMNLGGEGVVPKIAHELVDQGLPHNKTTAGKVVQKALLEAEARFEKKMKRMKKEHEKLMKEGKEEAARENMKLQSQLTTQKGENAKQLKIMNRDFNASKKALDDQISELGKKLEKAEGQAKKSRKELAKSQKREIELDTSIKNLETKVANSESSWNNKKKDMEEKHQSEISDLKTQVNSMVKKQESSVPKGSIAAGLLGAATFVGSALTFNPIGMATGTAMMAGGGASIARHASSRS